MSKQFSADDTRKWLDAFPKKGVNVKLIIISDKGKVLLVKPSYKKTWQFPGGGVDAHEEPKEALLREVREEINLDMTEDQLKLIGTAFKRDYDHLFLIYESDKRLDENTDLNVPDEEMEGYKFFAVDVVAPLLADYYSDFWQDYLRRNR
jgi:8-oxo-dGTP diphosphatase